MKVHTGIANSKNEAGSSVPPFHFIIDMKKEITIAQIDLLNRGDGAANNIKWVEFYASNNNSEWDKIGAGDFNDEGTRATFRYYVKSTKARYLKLIIPEGYGNNCTSCRHSRIDCLRIRR